MKRAFLAVVLGATALTAAAPAFAQSYGAPAAGGYGDRDHDRDRDRMRHDERGGGYGFGREFYRGAPESPWERMQWLQQRIERGRADGSLNPREAMRAQREVERTREYIRTNRQRYGQLRQVDRDYVQQRLDYISQRIRWSRHNGR